MPRYRKKPVVIEAMEFTGTFANYDEICEWAKTDFASNSGSDVEVEIVFIQTLEGEMIAKVGDYIIRGVKGEYYPCKPDIFDATYEAVE
jgi:hypothetical protein